ncbi:MAG: DEAD/DEAH box helicase [Acidimicrobiales bacterium]
MRSWSAASSASDGATISSPTDVRRQFVADAGFDLDDFQIRALDAIDDGCNVVVAAPTGSGKTVVAAYALQRALAEGRKAFYTTPLKALSNQKYAELVRRHGSAAVGLLTGDNAVNGSAPLVVMTTEVLRNMIYASSPTLRGLRYVVLDEVHYLQNTYRGPVWEEVIIHAPSDVDLVCLSATVSNAGEFADWIRAVRGATATIVEERRPVDLHDLYLVGDRRSDRLLVLPTLVDGRPNAEALALDTKRAPQPGPRGRSRGRLYTPRRPEIVEQLEQSAMLPAIFFIFSRAACDDAVRSCLREGLRLTTTEELRQVRAIADAHLDALSAQDLRLLDHGAWISGLEAGFAAHHAGMVPPFKEAVEACFAAGLVKVVFATETLSLGINMPARTVVIEKLTKFTGERHEFLTAGEYTQLIGRAGRRGIDDVGYAMVPWSPFVTFDQVASLAGDRRFVLTSSFRPTYNMAANLVRRYPPDEAHHLLNLSFAQYQADGDIVRLETQLSRSQATLDEAAKGVVCNRGDAKEYRRLLGASEEAARQRPSMTAAVSASLERVRPGDVLVVPGARSGGRVAVLSTARRRGGEVRLRAITTERQVVTLRTRDFPGPPRPVGRVRLPTPFTPTQSGFQRQVASSLRALRLDPGPRPESGEGRNGGGHWRGEQAMARAAEAAAHPVARCPDARAHLRALDRTDRLARDVERMTRRIKSRSDSLARQFDRVLQVLERRGYVDGWSLTSSGDRLGRLYHESDLLIAAAIDRGILDGLAAADLAGLVSGFTYETRRAEAEPRHPGGRLTDRLRRIERLCVELNGIEEDAGLPLTRAPDPGFVALARAWAEGEDLATIVGDGPGSVTGGDFVRNIKQLIDLLRQIGDLAPDPATARSAREAAQRLFRGVVVASSVLTG